MFGYKGNANREVYIIHRGTLEKTVIENLEAFAQVKEATLENPIKEKVLYALMRSILLDLHVLLYNKDKSEKLSFFCMKILFYEPNYIQLLNPLEKLILKNKSLLEKVENFRLKLAAHIDITERYGFGQQKMSIHTAKQIAQKLSRATRDDSDLLLNHWKKDGQITHYLKKQRYSLEDFIKDMPKIEKLLEVSKQCTVDVWNEYITHCYKTDTI